MPPVDRIIHRVEKLLRLAAPSSNTNEHERASAALEAAKLIQEHDLVVAAREKPKPVRVERTRRQRTAQNQSVGWGSVAARPSERGFPLGWSRSTAARDSVCADPQCGEIIERGEPVWIRMKGFDVEYLHINGPCGW